MKKQILLAVIFISSILCGKLTPEEDEHRVKTCGRVGNLKSNTTHDQAPWVHQFMIQKTFDSQDAEFWTAFLISPRHVLVKSHHLIDTTYDQSISGEITNFTWLYSQSRLPVDVSQCKDNVLTFSEQHRKGMKVRLICEGGDCGSKDHHLVNVTSVHYFGNCELGKPDNGIVLAEIEEPAIVRTPNGNVPLTPICPAGKTTKINVGDKVIEHYATDTLDTIWVLIEDKGVSIEKCVDVVLENFLCVKDMFIPGSGGFVRKIDGIETLLTLNIIRFDIAFSVALFHDKICEYSGVCKENIPPKIETTPTADGSEDGSVNGSSVVFRAFELLILISILVLV